MEKSNFLFTYNQKCYQIESVCKNVKDLSIEDGRHILFLNTKGIECKISNDLEALFEYINANEQWRIEYMKYYFDMQDQYDKGVAEGAAKYEAKAKEKEAQSVKNFYSKNIPLETISECTGLSLDEVKKIISTK